MRISDWSSDVCSSELIPDQAILRSTANYAIADITIDFVDGTDIYWARQQVAERLSSVLPDLPASVSGGLAPISTPLSDIYMFTIEGPLSLQQKRELLDWTRSAEHTSELQSLMRISYAVFCLQKNTNHNSTA